MPRLTDESSVDQVSQMRELWRYEYVEYGKTGFNASSDPALIAAPELSKAVNVITDRGLLASEFGYNSLLASDYLPPDFDTIRRLYLYIGKSTTQQLVFTNKFLYRFDSAFNILVPVQSSAGTKLLTASSAAGTNTFTANGTFAVGDYVVVTLVDGFAQTVKVSSVAGNVATFNPPLRQNAPVNSIIYKTPTFNGTNENQIVVDNFAGVETVFWTNGVDAPQGYNGTMNQPVQGLQTDSGQPVAVVCKTLCCHFATLLLGNITENGVPWPTRVRWCDIGSPNVWTWSVNFLDINETPDYLISLNPLNTYVMAYKDQSIFRLEYVGNENLTWSLTKTIEDEGVLSPLSVCDINNLHFVIGRRNIYIYDGEFALKPISEPMLDRFIGPRSVFKRDLSAKVFSFYLPPRQEVWMFMPVEDEQEFDDSWSDGSYWDDETGWDFTTGAVSTEVYRLKIDNGAWTRRKYPFDVTAAGIGFFTTGMTWQQAQLEWSAANFSWISTSVGGQEDTPIFANHTDNAIYKYDFKSSTDNGKAIPWLLETRDFSQSNDALRFDRFDLFIGGAQCKLSYSTDRGNTWNVIKTFPEFVGMRRVRTYKQFVATNVRFRLEGSGFMQFRFFGFSWKIESVEGQ